MILSTDRRTAGLARGSIRYGNSVSEAVQYAAKSMEVEEVQREVYALAEQLVLPRLRAYAGGAGKWALVLDVDGTVLNDADFDYQVGEEGREFDLAEHTEWLRSGKVKPIPGAREFLDAARGVSAEQGGRGAIFYITNCEGEAEDIIANLRNNGLFLGGDTLVKTGPDLDKGEARRRIEVMGFRIEASFGDSFRDHFEMRGEDARTRGKELLDQAVAEGRAFVLPNGFYGQWQTSYNAGDNR